MNEAIDTAPADAAPARPSTGLRFWRHPVTQLIARILFFALLAAGMGYLLRLVIVLPAYKGEDGMVRTLSETGATPWLRQLRNLLPSILAYWLMVRVLEHRKLREFEPRKAPPHLATGWLVGMGILLAAAAALALPGYYAVHGTHPDAPLAAPLLVLGIGAGVGEEIVARGVLFRVVEECFGTWFALLFSAALFGLGHIANPNSSVWMALAIAIEAGLLLGMAFAWTRSMWFVIALHAAWNFTQGPILGIPVSGIAVTGLLDSTLQGPPVLSGGRFGAEGSLLTVIICMALALYFTRKAIAAERIVPPFWKRRRADGTVAVPSFEAAAPGLRKA